ncbi:hypothetical protein ACTD5D_40470 [Nocardia takedensis]|uniref:hypothetical protein n=1 Tax=Nocardia takedensis TaxID=259390 RepID=UPI003F775217
MFRTWQGSYLTAGPVRYPAVPALGVALLNAHYRYRHALEQFLRATTTGGDGAGCAVTDALHTAHNDRDRLVAEIDEVVTAALTHTSLPVTPGIPVAPPSGPGALLAGLARWWVAIDCGRDTVAVAQARARLALEATAYDRFVEDLRTRRTHPAATPSHHGRQGSATSNAQ